MATLREISNKVDSSRVLASTRFSSTCSARTWSVTSRCTQSKWGSPWNRNGTPEDSISKVVPSLRTPVARVRRGRRSTTALMKSGSQEPACINSEGSFPMSSSRLYPNMAQAAALASTTRRSPGAWMSKLSVVASKTPRYCCSL